MESLTFKLEEFEGPLDLLLYLVGKNKMDLHEIAILDLIDQYTAVINTLTDHRLDVASEFIEMAARLVQMKSYLLLPRSEEAERLKQELTGQLIEYSACKKIAARMGAMAAATFTAVRQPMEVELDNTYQLRHDASLLQQAWFGLMGRSRRKTAPSAERFEPLVTAPFVSVASRVVHVLRGLVTGRVRQLRNLFSPSGSRSETVATFLAVLELVRAGRITIDDNETLAVRRGKTTHREE
ncbi:MAG TPA: segregation/condensation protein A [Candidatus Fournierella merdipullorum]|uniref:Segregation and condensation protein A n=1 Tax=Candidatus Allofournierella merdipullorum TaxID=2838595 RepID=A0A9D2IYJ5_9FIRM|nr:segregation/condensation protein A [Candidatus Fournierella merdipullorum]